MGLSVLHFLINLADFGISFTCFSEISVELIRKEQTSSRNFISLCDLGNEALLQFTVCFITHSVCVACCYEKSSVLLWFIL